MTETVVTPETEPRRKRHFTLPSAYAVLLALIVLTAIATWVIPAGIIVMVGFLGVTMKSGAIRPGIGSLVER